MNTLTTSPAWPGLIELVITLVSLVLSGVAIPALKRWMAQQGIQISREREAVLEKALRGAIGFAEEWAYHLAIDRADPIARQRMAERSRQYVLNAVPQTIAALNLTPEDIERMIFSRMPTPQGLPPGVSQPASAAALAPQPSPIAPPAAPQIPAAFR